MGGYVTNAINVQSLSCWDIHKLKLTRWKWYRKLALYGYFAFLLKI